MQNVLEEGGNRMKRVVAAILCLIMVSSLMVGCSKNGKGSKGKDGKVIL